MAAVVATTRWPGHTRGNWWLLAGLAAAATVCHYATRPGEERRYSADMGGEHVDLSSVWLFPGAILLSVPQTTVLVLLTQAQRYRIARRPLSRHQFTTAAILGSMLATHLVVGGLIGQPWTDPVRTGPLGQAAVPIALAAGIAAYWCVQTLLICGVRLVGADCRVTATDLREALGDARDNALILGGLALAAVFTGVVAWSPLALAFAVPVTLAVTQLIEREAHAQARSDRDPKTHLLTEPAWTAKAAQALLSHDQHGPIAVAMVDVDDFRACNEQYGHVSADIALLAIAGVLRERCRDGEVARWGGDEFAALLLHAPLDQAAAIAERVRSAVAELKLAVSLPAGGEPVIASVSVTIGVAQVVPGETITAALGRADTVLMAGKPAGRNAVYVAPTPEPAAGHFSG